MLLIAHFEAASFSVLALAKLARVPRSRMLHLHLGWLRLARNEGIGIGVVRIVVGFADATGTDLAEELGGVSFRWFTALFTDGGLLHAVFVGTGCDRRLASVFAIATLLTGFEIRSFWTEE